jgi:hypothetical protein
LYVGSTKDSFINLMLEKLKLKGAP